jgi:hypothetical protein
MIYLLDNCGDLSLSTHLTVTRNINKGGVKMDKFFSFLNKLFLIVAVIAIIVAVLAKLFGFVWFGLYPLSYLRFTEACLFFVAAISLYQIARAKAPKRAAAKKRKR